MPVIRTQKSRRAACVVAVFAGTLAGCSSLPGTGGLYEPGEIHVEARQSVLEENVGVVDERSRELRERFNALERLYVDLVQQSSTNADRLIRIEEQLSIISGSSASAASMVELTADVRKIKDELAAFEERVFSIELAGGVGGGRQTVSQNGPTAATEAPLEDDATMPVAAAEEPEEPKFGVHLGSYRSMDQIPGSWAAFRRVFVDEVGGLDPRVYTQTQEGIGDFMRLIAGPLDTMADAEALCISIKGRAREQYCEASEYQGEPLGASN